MVANQKVTGRALSMPAGIGMGLALCIGVTLVGSALVGWLVSREILPYSGIGYGSMGILLSASILGAWMAVSRVKRQRLVVCLVLGLTYYLVLLSVTALFFGGEYSGMGVTALVILAGCGTVALLGLKGERGAKRRRPKFRSR